MDYMREGWLSSMKDIVKWKYFYRKTIEDKIKKHIFDLKEEIPYWKRRWGNLDDLKQDYSKRFYKPDTELFIKYDRAARDNIYKHFDSELIKVYIYKGENGYSCNFSHLDRLTTCTKISFNDKGDLSKCTILSCFYRNSFSFDSLIFLLLRTLPITINGRCVEDKSFLSNYESLETAKFETMNNPNYNSYSINHKRGLLLLNYLFEQWKHHKKNNDIKFENYSYMYYLMLRLSFSIPDNLVHMNSIYEASLDLSIEKSNVINKIYELKKMVGNLKNEIEYYNGEMSLLLLCYYAMGEDIGAYIIDEDEEVKENIDMIIGCL